MVDSELASLLQRFPDAHILAMSLDGARQPVPQWVQLLDTHVLLQGRLIDLVKQGDEIAVVDGWEAVRSTGRATTTATLRSDPSSSIEIHWCALTEPESVVVAIIARSSDNRPAATSQLADQRSRLCYQRRDTSGRILSTDAAAQRMLGFANDDLVDQKALEFVHPDDRGRAIETWMSMLARPGTPLRVRVRHRRGDDSYLWVEITNTRSAEEPDEVESQLLDISGEMAMQEALRAREELLTRLAETLPVGLLQVSRSGEIEFSNDRMHEMTGASGSTTKEHLAWLTGPSRRAAVTAFTESLRTGQPRDLEVELLDDHHAAHTYDLRIRPLHGTDGSVSGVLACATDITEAAMMRRQLEIRATVDSLTGCLNRAATLRALDDRLADPAAGVLISFIDIDRLKEANDTYGHAAGDEILRVLSQRLLETVRTGDVVGRIGGDEFVVVSVDIARAHVDLVTERLKSATECAVFFHGVDITVSASLGSAWTARSGVLARDLLAEADAEMYLTKHPSEVGQTS